MKLVLFILLLIAGTTIKAQPSVQHLKSAVITAENKNYLKKHKEAKIISTDITIYNTRLIPLRDWWKGLYNVHHKFSTEMELLTRLYDSIHGDHAHNTVESSLQNKSSQKPGQQSFDGEAYFKKKYESTDSTIKVYEVYYRVNLQSNDGIGYFRDSVRTCLYPKDLSEVKSF